jgi:serine/threonine protein kinase
MASVPEIRGYADFARVGRGGFSVVYAARQVALDRQVAIKVLLADLEEEDQVRRFTNECRILGRLGMHKHVVDVYDAGVTDEGRPYIVMKFYAGGSLADRLKKAGPLSASEVVSIGVKMAAALQAAHAIGVIHRDVKPDNILIDDDGEPVLTDFGVAAVADAAGAYTSSVAFSRAHVAPEVLDRNAFGVASDVYGLGSTLFTLLTGRAAFAADTEARQILAILNDPPPAIDQPGVPVGLSAVIATAMAKRPTDRYATAELLREALLAIDVTVFDNTQIDEDTGPRPGRPAAVESAAALVAAEALAPETPAPETPAPEEAATPADDADDPTRRRTAVPELLVDESDVTVRRAPVESATEPSEHPAWRPESGSGKGRGQCVRCGSRNVARRCRRCMADVVVVATDEGWYPDPGDPAFEVYWTPDEGAADVGRRRDASIERVHPGSKPVAGWYVDPGHSFTDRFWDGGNWTDRVRDAWTGEELESVSPVVDPEPADVEKTRPKRADPAPTPAAPAADAAVAAKPKEAAPTKPGAAASAAKSRKAPWAVALVVLAVIAVPLLAFAMNRGSSPSGAPAAAAAAAPTPGLRSTAVESRQEAAASSAPRATPTPTPTATPESVPANLVHSVRLAYAGGVIPDKVFDATLKWTADLCVGDPSLLKASNKAKISLYRKAAGTWKRQASKVDVSRGGRCKAGYVNVLIGATEPPPARAEVGEGWSDCSTYRVVTPETGSYAKASIDLCVRTKVIATGQS